MTLLADHYDALLARERFDRPSTALGDLPASAVGRRFVAADGRVPDPPGTMVSTGVGMTGPPHLGTLGAIRTATVLQDAGYDVQFVLADYEPHAAGRDRETVAGRAERYRSLVERMGFDAGAGTLRPQVGTDAAREAMERAFLLAPEYDPAVWEAGDDVPPTAFERANAATYDRRECREADAHPGSDAADTMSGVLHLADFLLPLAEWGYDRVLLAFGADEYGLLAPARRLRERAGIPGRLAGIYIRLVPGVDGAPKMAKRLPGTGLDLSRPPGELEGWIRDLPDGGPGSPAAAVLALLRTGSGPLPEPGTEPRRDALAAVAAEVADLARGWRESGG